METMEFEVARGGGIPETPWKVNRVDCVEVTEGTIGCVTADWENN